MLYTYLYRSNVINLFKISFLNCKSILYLAESISYQVVHVYVYVTYYFEIKIFMFFSKNYLTRIFNFLIS